MKKHIFTAGANSLQVVSEYIFDVPRHQVFKAFVDPTLIPKWWIDPTTTLIVEKMDVRNGGEWRFINRIEGGDYLFRGVYHKVVDNELVVTTWAFDPMPSVMLETVKFEDIDGKTKVIDQYLFQSLEDRQAMMDSGVTESAILAMRERLEELL